MIKSCNLKPFIGNATLPAYVTGVRSHTLLGELVGGYKITLAKLATGKSDSAGNILSHAIFESFTDHGDRMKSAKGRASGCDSDYIAIRNAMAQCGVETESTLPLPSEVILRALGDWYMAANPDICKVSVVSQTCH